MQVEIEELVVGHFPDGFEIIIILLWRCIDCFRCGWVSEGAIFYFRHSCCERSEKERVGVLLQF